MRTPTASTPSSSPGYPSGTSAAPSPSVTTARSRSEPCRPAHIHVKASAVKPELMLYPKPAADGSGSTVEYDFVLDPARS